MNEHDFARAPGLARPVAGFLLEHKHVLRQAHQEYLAAGGGKAGSLAVREYLAGELRHSVPGLAAEDYRHAVADLRKAGRDEDAVLVWRAALAESAIEDARRTWTERYKGRPQTWALTAADTMAAAGLLEFLPAPPGLGAEGAAYLPAIARAGTGTEPVLILAARGGSELIRGWASEAQMLEWAAERTTAATGPLTAPPAPVTARTWREDTMLARLLRHPGEVAAARQLLPPHTCTTDVRYDTYAALLALSGRHEMFLLGNVDEEVSRQLGHVPEDGMTYYGGERAPLASRYLARLARTRVSHGQFADAVKALHLEDRRARENAAASNLARAPVADASQTLLEAPPGLQPGGPPGPAGPVQGR